MRVLCCPTLFPWVCIYKDLFNEKAIKQRVLSPTQRKENERVNKRFMAKRMGKQGRGERPQVWRFILFLDMQAHGSQVAFGCLDHDDPRHRLSRLALLLRV